MKINENQCKSSVKSNVKAMKCPLGAFEMHFKDFERPGRAVSMMEREKRNSARAAPTAIERPRRVEPREEVETSS